MNKVFKVDGLDCASCAAELEELVSRVEGVKDAAVDFIGQKVRFTCSFEEQAEKVKAVCNSFEDVKVVADLSPDTACPQESGHAHCGCHSHGEKHKEEHAHCCHSHGEEHKEEHAHCGCHSHGEEHKEHAHCCHSHSGKDAAESRVGVQGRREIQLENID